MFFHVNKYFPVILIYCITLTLYMFNYISHYIIHYILHYIMLYITLYVYIYNEEFRTVFIFYDHI